METADSLLANFAASDAALTANQTKAAALREENCLLMEGWSSLVTRGDMDEISRRSIRRAEISTELARLGC